MSAVSVSSCFPFHLVSGGVVVVMGQLSVSGVRV